MAYNYYAYRRHIVTFLCYAADHPLQTTAVILNILTVPRPEDTIGLVDSVLDRLLDIAQFFG